MLLRARSTAAFLGFLGPRGSLLPGILGFVTIEQHRKVEFELNRSLYIHGYLGRSTSHAARSTAYRVYGELRAGPDAHHPAIL